MRKRGWLCIVCLSAGVALVASHSVSPREPVYEGKKLSYWVHLLGDSVPVDAEYKHAAEIIRRTGPDALPFLLSWLRSEPRLTRDFADKVLEKTPVLNRNRSLHEWMYGEKRENRADDTVHVFEILDRSLAKSAVPKLTAFLNDSRHHYTAMRAADALAYIGDDGVPFLLNALEQPGHHALQPVMCALFFAPPKGTNAILAVNLLVRYTRDKRFMVAQTAVDALGAIAIDSQKSLPALTEALASEDPEVREAAASAIGKFGTNADTVLPALLAVLKDSSPRVQASASNAVAMIQPQVFPPPVIGSRSN